MTFVLPDKVFGEADDEIVVYQPPVEIKHSYAVGGEFETWQRDVARYAIGNSRLTVAISMALAPPLLHVRGNGRRWSALSRVIVHRQDHATACRR